MSGTARNALMLCGALALAGFVAVAIIAGVSNAVTPTFDAFGKVAGVWIGVVPPLIAAGASIFVFVEQKRAGAELEQFKARLASELEAIKGRLAAQRKSYDELNAAALQYYYTLARLENGTSNADLIAKADDAMLAACRYTAFVKVEDRNTWMRLWQAARALGEAATPLGDAQQQRALWARHVADLSQRLEQFVAAVTAAHASPQ